MPPRLRGRGSLWYDARGVPLSRSSEAGKEGSGSCGTRRATALLAARAFLCPPAMSAKLVLDADAIRRAVVRMAHEIVEKNRGASDVVIVGIWRRGEPLANRLADAIALVEGVRPPVGTLDVTFHRDDIDVRGLKEPGRTEIAVPITDRTVVLVDDVLFTGRTVRAALDALMAFGRPRRVQLAVLVDRGHRELPVRADYVGKNLPTSREEDVRVRLAEMDGVDGVYIARGDAE